MRRLAAVVAVLVALGPWSACADDVRPWMAFTEAREAAVQARVPTYDVPGFMIGRLGPLPWRFMQAAGVVEVTDIGMQREEYGDHVAFRTRAHVVYTWVGRGQGISAEDVAVGPLLLADPDALYSFRRPLIGPYGLYR